MEEQKSVFSGLVDFFHRGWDVNEGLTNARCEAYTSQISNAQEQLNRKDLSKKDRKFFKKEKLQALDGLHNLDIENKDFILKLLFGAGFACLAFAKLTSAIQGNHSISEN